jgi:hypothetical protein
VGPEVWPWRVMQDHFEVSVHITVHDFSLLRADNQMVVDPSVACVVCGVQILVLFRELLVSRSQSSCLSLYLIVLVDVLTCDDELSWIIWAHVWIEGCHIWDLT